MAMSFNLLSSTPISELQQRLRARTTTQESGTARPIPRRKLALFPKGDGKQWRTYLEVGGEGEPEILRVLPFAGESGQGVRSLAGMFSATRENDVMNPTVEVQAQQENFEIRERVGETLTVAIERLYHKGWYPEWSKVVILQIAEALADLASRNLVHGSLSAASVVIHDDDVTATTKSITPNSGPAGVDGLVPALLSSPTLAPEQILTGERQGPTSEGDAWRLGALMFHLLTGTPLKMSPQNVKILQTCLSSEEPSNSQFVADILRDCPGVANLVQARGKSTSDIAIETIKRFNSPRFLALMRQLLSLNPGRRPRIQEVLESGLFQDSRSLAFDSQHSLVDFVRKAKTAREAGRATLFATKRRLVEHNLREHQSSVTAPSSTSSRSKLAGRVVTALLAAFPLLKEELTRACARALVLVDRLCLAERSKQLSGLFHAQLCGSLKFALEAKGRLSLEDVQRIVEFARSPNVCNVSQPELQEQALKLLKFEDMSAFVDLQIMDKTGFGSEVLSTMLTFKGNLVQHLYEQEGLAWNQVEVASGEHMGRRGHLVSSRPGLVIRLSADQAGLGEGQEIMVQSVQRVSH